MLQIAHVSDFLCELGRPDSSFAGLIAVSVSLLAFTFYCGGGGSVEVQFYSLSSVAVRLFWAHCGYRSGFFYVGCCHKDFPWPVEQRNIGKSAPWPSCHKQDQLNCATLHVTLKYLRIVSLKAWKGQLENFISKFVDNARLPASFFHLPLDLNLWWPKANWPERLNCKVLLVLLVALMEHYMHGAQFYLLLTSPGLES